MASFRVLRRLDFYPRTVNVLTLCTGNAARSVMLGYMLETVAKTEGWSWQIRTAGTHVSEGQGISARTRDAIVAIEELSHHPVTQHRSHQLNDDDCEWADVIVTAEADHVRYVRARHPQAAPFTVSVGALLRHSPLAGGLADRVRAVSAVDLDDALDVADPAGKDQEAYDACAQELWDMSLAVAVLLGPDA